ncbi:MAG TPA: GNAT family N-acetyltransferase [Blastocatellia bacterium]|nr:GNAT family N-acetyltransferase [Blastocatellia bacterium]
MALQGVRVAIQKPIDRTIPVVSNQVTVSPLTDDQKAEVLDFLSARPLHTVFLAGFIRDNGMVSPLNRGAFYAARNGEGRLEGVGLIGHATLIESRSDAALEAFAHFARACPSAHMILGEKKKVSSFWRHYANAGETPRMVCRELLMETRRPARGFKQVPGLRVATLDDIDCVMKVNAEMAFSESGVNPLERDPAGFRARVARRIEQGRVWLWSDRGRLIFKAEVMSETDEVVYLEGVYVDPRERGTDQGLRCFSQLCETLMARGVSVCLLVNEKNRKARAFYRKAGYGLRSRYDTIFLRQKNG